MEHALNNVAAIRKINALGARGVVARERLTTFDQRPVAVLTADAEPCLDYARKGQNR